MKNVLVMGINGTFGGQMTNALLDAGYKVTAFLRDTKKLPEKYKHVKTVKGDVKNLQSIRQACEDIDIIVYGVSPANYDWREKAVPYLDNVAQIAEEKKLTIIFPGNVYVFDPADGPEFNEDSPRNPITEKGQMRQTMENRLEQAAKHGAKIIILRMGDFIAPDAKSAWLPVLLKNKKNNHTLSSPGTANLIHSWAYVPDAARVACQLLEKSDQLPAFNVFHYKGYQSSIKQIAQTIEMATGNVVKIKQFPWWFFKLSAPFFTLFRGLVEMSYLWKTEINMSDEKLRKLLGKNYQATDLRTALIDSQLIKTKNEAGNEENKEAKENMIKEN